MIFWFGLRNDKLTRYSFPLGTPWTLKLAQTLYMAYTEELMQTIRDDEAEFVKTYAEITEIQEGKHDERLRREAEEAAY